MEQLVNHLMGNSLMRKRFMTQYTVAIYCRLSRDDGGDAESNSIATQRQMLRRYAKEQGFTVYDEYVDDGVSGTTFDRPALKRMLADMEAGRINCIVCKDLSRFGRNNAMVAFYTEEVFPNSDVRFIAVNDNIDTALDDNCLAPFMSVINEYYARDISKKIRSAKRTIAMNGEFAAGRAPFGYIKDPGNKRKLMVDEETSGIVRRIFEMRAAGHGICQIASRLSDDRVKTPIAYEYERTGNYAKYYNADASCMWSSKTIDNMLRNPAYLGHVVSHRFTTKSFKNSKQIPVPEEDWIIVKDTHPPLVSQEIFDRVSSIERAARRVDAAKVENIFSGLLVCPDCGYKMSMAHYPRKDGTNRIFYNCGGYRQRKRAASQCTAHYVPHEELCAVVVNDITDALHAVLKMDKFIQSLQCDESGKSEDASKIGKLRKREVELKNLTKKALELNVSGAIDDAGFTALYNDYRLEQMDIADKLRALEDKATQFRDVEENARLFAEALEKYRGAVTVSRELLLDLIEKIVVHEATGEGLMRVQMLEIHYRFIGQRGAGVHYGRL
jgi:DNA invertase Pin-like site-specific DNA recombinase